MATAEPDRDNLWQLLGHHSPHGIIAIDAAMYVKLVNPAFCQMFGVEAADIIGQPAVTIFDEIDDFERVWRENSIIRSQCKEYPQQNLYLQETIFAIAAEGLVVCTVIDLSHELEQHRELKRLRNETVAEVNAVVDKQMKVVQEIAGLLGETTAETKVSLLKIVRMLESDRI